MNSHFVNVSKESCGIDSTCLVNVLLNKSLQIKRLKFDLEKVGGLDKSLKGIIKKSDIKEKVYEGGFVCWECSADLCNYMLSIQEKFKRQCVLELGCGHGLPGIISLYCCGSNFVYFQDYNDEVLNIATIHNVIVNCPVDSLVDDVLKRCAFIGGDWISLSSLFQSPSFSSCSFSHASPTVILSSETVYRESSFGVLSDILRHFLRRGDSDSFALFSGKSYYFGLGGGIDAFAAYLTGKNTVFDSDEDEDQDENVICIDKEKENVGKDSSTLYGVFSVDVVWKSASLDRSVIFIRLL